MPFSRVPWASCKGYVAQNFEKLDTPMNPVFNQNKVENHCASPRNSELIEGAWIDPPASHRQTE